MPPKSKKAPPPISSLDSDRQLELTEQLADEIAHVYQAVAEVIPDADNRIGSTKPTWIPLSDKSKATMRDYVVHGYAHPTAMAKPSDRTNIVDQAITCPLSFDTASNPRAFDVDHFHPQREMMDKIDTILVNDPLLLEGVRARVEEKLGKTLGRDRATAVVNKLITPDVSTAPQDRVKGLKNIYYNYPANLWPISGPTNSSKGAQEPLELATEMTLKNLKKYASPEEAHLMCDTIDNDLALPSGTSESDIDTAVTAVSAGFSKQFEDRAKDTTYQILPHFSPATGIGDSAPKPVVGELDFFKSTPLGEATQRYCQINTEMAIRNSRVAHECMRSGPEAIEAAQIVTDSLSHAIHASHTDPPTRGDEKVLGLLLHSGDSILSVAIKRAALGEVKRHIEEAVGSIVQAQEEVKKISAIPDARVPSVSIDPVLGENTNTTLPEIGDADLTTNPPENITEGQPDSDDDPDAGTIPLTSAGIVGGSGDPSSMPILDTGGTVNNVRRPTRTTAGNTHFSKKDRVNIAPEMEPNIEQLANEIVHVYQAVAEVIPDAIYRINKTEPTWIQLNPGVSDKATMRDYILHSYTHPDQVMTKPEDRAGIIDEAITCPLSFDTASNPRAFDIDHFHPQTKMMSKIDTLLGDRAKNTDLVEAVRMQVEKKLADSLEPKHAKKVTDALIIPDGEGFTPGERVKGLKNIYYNYPANLWPISGPTNSSKGAQEPLELATEMTLKNLKKYASPEEAHLMCDMIDNDLALPSGTSESDIDTAVTAVSAGFSKQFEDRAKDTTYQILPHFSPATEIGDSAPKPVIGKLDFFKSTPLGEATQRYCQINTEMAIRNSRVAHECMRSGPEAIEAAQIVTDSLSHAIHASHTDPPTRGDEKVLGLLLHSGDSILSVAIKRAALGEVKRHIEHARDSLQSAQMRASGIQARVSPDLDPVSDENRDPTLPDLEDDANDIGGTPEPDMAEYLTAQDRDSDSFYEYHFSPTLDVTPTLSPGIDESDDNDTEIPSRFDDATVSTPRASLSVFGGGAGEPSFMASSSHDVKPIHNAKKRQYAGDPHTAETTGEHTGEAYEESGKETVDKASSIPVAALTAMPDKRAKTNGDSVKDDSAADDVCHPCQ